MKIILSILFVIALASCGKQIVDKPIQSEEISRTFGTGCMPWTLDICCYSYDLGGPPWQDVTHLSTTSIVIKRGSAWNIADTLILK